MIRCYRCSSLRRFHVVPARLARSQGSQSQRELVQQQLTQCLKPKGRFRSPDISLRGSRRARQLSTQARRADGALNGPINGAGPQIPVAQTEEEWLVLDAKVNKYPDRRTFKAVGKGGQPFVDAMVAAVETVVGPLESSQVSQRLSKEETYISVSVGPVVVKEGSEVLAVFRAMKADSRLRFCM